MLRLLALLRFSDRSLDQLLRFSLLLSILSNTWLWAFSAETPEITRLPFTIMLPFDTSLPFQSMKLHPLIMVGFSQAQTGLFLEFVLKPVLENCDCISLSCQVVLLLRESASGDTLLWMGGRLALPYLRIIDYFLRDPLEPIELREPRDYTEFSPLRKESWLWYSLPEHGSQFFFIANQISVIFFYGSDDLIFICDYLLFFLGTSPYFLDFELDLLDRGGLEEGAFRLLSQKQLSVFDSPLGQQFKSYSSLNDMSFLGAMTVYLIYIFSFSSGSAKLSQQKEASALGLICPYVFFFSAWFRGMTASFFFDDFLLLRDLSLPFEEGYLAQADGISSNLFLVYFSVFFSFYFYCISSQQMRLFSLGMLAFLAIQAYYRYFYFCLCFSNAMRSDYYCRFLQSALNFYCYAIYLSLSIWTCFFNYSSCF